MPPRWRYTMLAMWHRINLVCPYTGLCEIKHQSKCMVCNYFGIRTFRLLHFNPVLVTQSISPIWRRVITMTSLHLVDSSSSITLTRWCLEILHRSFADSRLQNHCGWHLSLWRWCRPWTDWARSMLPLHPRQDAATPAVEWRSAGQRGGRRCRPRCGDEREDRETASPDTTTSTHNKTDIAK